MKKLLAVTAASVLLGGCIQQPMYNWGGYEGSLYSYYKAPARASDLETALAEVMDAEQWGDKVAPGLYAEYGLVLMNAGKPDEARRYFEKEKERWPESAVFMQVLLKSTASSATAAATTPVVVTPVSATATAGE